MSFRIIRIETYGMKGLEKPISFQFLNDTIDHKTFDKPSIKAIYGLNGSGKTSFITAIDVYKNICSSYSYLVEDSSVKTLNKLINNKSKEFGIKVVYQAETKRVFCHELVVSNESSRPYISKEKFSRIDGKSINGEYQVVFETKASNIKYLTESKFSDAIYDRIKMALEKKNEYTGAVALFSDINFLNSISSIKDEQKKIKGMLKVDDFIDSLEMSFITLASFVQNINVFLGSNDTHLELGSELGFIVNSLFKFSYDGNNLVNGEAFVPTDKIDGFLKKIQKMAKFIKLFKPELKSIDVEKRINGSVYNCRLVMNYGDYSVDYDYESTGLKNLISMFSCLNQASMGGIAFIDEMDANMNEVYLEKLCEFFVNHGKGQLCFTTHNTAPMSILKKQKYGIDFINSSKESVQWIRNGNYSPSKLYSEGMIPGLPFNLEDFDFLQVFFPEEA